MTYATTFSPSHAVVPATPTGVHDAIGQRVLVRTTGELATVESVQRYSYGYVIRVRFGDGKVHPYYPHHLETVQVCNEENWPHQECMVHDLRHGASTRFFRPGDVVIGSDGVVHVVKAEGRRGTTLVKIGELV